MNDPKNIHLPRADKRAGLYPRVSKTNGRDADDLEKHTLSEQRELAVAYLPREWELVENELWRDVNVSGKNFDRPGLHRLLEAVQAGEINAVAVGYLSRFGRNAREVLENVETLRELGAALFIGKERLTILPDEKDPMTRLILTVLAAVAELELARLSEQLGRSNRTAIASGVSISVPYGYRRSNGNGSPLEVDDSQDGMPAGWSPARVVGAIFGWRAEGRGDQEIADKLNGLGIPTKSALAHRRGQRKKPGAALWKHNTVANLVGIHTYRGVIPRATEFEERPKNRRSKRVPVAWEFLPGDHPALIDADLWEQAQRRRQRAVRNGKVGSSLLGGLVRCGNCSQTMKPTANGQGVLTYACRGRKSGCSAPVSITREGLDRYVVERLFEQQDAATIDQSADRAELDAAEADAREAQRILDDFDRFADPGEWGDGFMAARRQRVHARDEAEDRAARLRVSVRAGEQRSLVGWDELPLDERQAALGELLDAVAVFKTEPGDSPRDYAARTELCFAGRAPFELSGTGRIVAPRPWPRS